MNFPIPPERPQETDCIPFDREELDRVYRSTNIDPKLNNKNLRKAAEVIFKGGDSFSQEFYQKTIVAGNYQEFDLDGHGFPKLLGDLKLLIHFFSTAVHTVQSTTRNRTQSILMIGSGPGRLAIPTIELAKKSEIKEIIFNDLLTDHVDKIKTRIQEVYGSPNNADGVMIKYLSGDFVEQASSIEEQFDAIFANWYVTSEIASFENTQKLREVRRKLYDSIRTLLSKQGVFVEDLPFSEGVGSAFYIGRLKTYKILHEMGILEGENESMLLSDFSSIQSEGFPFHIRYVPPNGKHRRELENAGLQENEPRVSTLPIGIKNYKEYAEHFKGDKKVKSLIEDNDIEQVLRYLESCERNYLLHPKTTDPSAEKMKTVLWRKEQ